MARRRPPATTAFGAWLSGWLDAHPDWTLDALAKEIGVSTSAVSLWLTKTKRIEPENLVGVARVTGEPFENLQRMVYAGQAPLKATGVTPELLDAIEERMRRAFREELQAVLAELRSAPR